MTKAIPTVSKYMSTTPIVVEPSTTLLRATALMKEHDIRHLPVVAGEKLVGLVTQSDLRIVAGLSGVASAQVKIEDIMHREPFSCGPDSSLDETVDAMVAHKWGSAVVMQNKKVVGIFTSVDAMRALVELTRTRLGK